MAEGAVASVFRLLRYNRTEHGHTATDAIFMKYSPELEGGGKETFSWQ
jgi:hypothetical protein